MGNKENPMSKIIVRCWEDEEFKKRLIADPHAVLSAEGVVIPEGVTVKVLMDTAKVQHLIIPSRVLADAALDALTAGGSYQVSSNACRIWFHI